MGADSQYVSLFLLPTLASLAAGVIIAVLFGGLKWSVKRHLAITLPVLIVIFVAALFLTRKAQPEQHLALAGTIVDQATNEPIGQALVKITGRSEQYLSEYNGNFRLDLEGIKQFERVRIHVTKDHYAPFDETVEVPAEGFVVRLQHL